MSSATLHAIRPKFGGKWKRSVVMLDIPLATLLYAGYNVCCQTNNILNEFPRVDIETTIIALTTEVCRDCTTTTSKNKFNLLIFLIKFQEIPHSCIRIRWRRRLVV